MKKILIKILVLTMIFSMFTVTTVKASDETDPHTYTIVKIQ